MFPRLSGPDKAPDRQENPIVPVVGQAARAEGFEDQGVEPVKQRVQKFAAAAGDQLVEKYPGIHSVIEDGGAGDGRLVINIKNNTIFLYDSDLRIIDAGKGIIALGPLFFCPGASGGKK